MINSIALARQSHRITTTDSANVTTISNLTISGFTLADNGGMVTCNYYHCDSNEVKRNIQRGVRVNIGE